MTLPNPSISVNLDVTNPGKFFACCGLLALADRLWPGAEGWFSDRENKFLISADGCLQDLVRAIASAEITPLWSSDPYSSPLVIGAPFCGVVIDWWEADKTGARDLKVWAGTMESVGIALAMQHAMRAPSFCSSDLFDIGMVVRSSEDPGKKKEPYYFDARRAPNAHSRDVGFSPNDLGLTSLAHPAVELLCVIGLQFARPVRLKPDSRSYIYHTWPFPILANLLLPASTGLLDMPGARGYRFENWFRTGQKKHKAFRSATLITKGLKNHDIKV